MGLFSHRFANFGREEHEGPAVPAKSGMVLSFIIPDAPYSDALFGRIHKAFEVVEGVHATLSIFEVEIAGLLGVSLEVLAPVAGFVLSVLAPALGYAEARARVAKEAVTSGFSHGVAMGADRRKWPYAKQMFWQNNAYRYATPGDDASGPIGQKSFNMGLACGYVQGRQLTAPGKPPTLKERFFWRSIGQALTDGDRYKYGGDTSTWSANMWSDWYIRVAGIFRQIYVKAPD
jgi:hypothetical protein